jgi:hypothetical protein
MIRKLTSLHKAIEPRKWYISFAYYKNDEFENPVWSGDSEYCELTEDELYELLKPRLKYESELISDGDCPPKGVVDCPINDKESQWDELELERRLGN